VGDPLPDGTVCDDRLYCTIGDACSGGTCAGGSRDCSAYSDQCNTGACSELGDTCYGRAVPDGTACDDGNPFTPRDGCLGGACAGSVCGDGILDGPAVGGREYCDDRNTITESCMAPPGGSCVRDCSIQQDTCGNGTLETAFGETCDDGNATSFDSCTTSCNPNDRGIGAPCTCTGTSCPMGNPTVGTIVGCDNVVVPPGARLACFRSGILAGNAGYFAAGFCSAYAHVCSPSLLCAFAGIPTTVGNYASFIGPCAAGSVVVQQTISASGVTLQTKSCQRVCTGDSDCRWNEYDSYWSECGQYVCMSSPSTPGTRVCFDPRMAMP
jgi:cysteine-rich repeat protein